MLNKPVMMLCAVVLFLPLQFLRAQSNGQPLSLAKEIHKPAPFLVHTGTGAFDNYLAMNIPYPPVQALWKRVEEFVKTPLKNRGEAHITVITPPEYTTILSKALTMEDINGIAAQMNIQQARFSTVCVGRAQVQIDGKKEQAYYLVVQSDDLLNIRRAIFKKYVEKGGEPSLFDPKHFYPHITIGFTKQDLHEEGNAVRKGDNSCFVDVIEQ